MKKIKKQTSKKKENILYVAGYFSKGENEGKKITIKVRSMPNLNPVEPILEAYPDIDCLIVSKSGKKLREGFSKLVGR